MPAVPSEDPEAAAALAQLKQKKEEEAAWQAWQAGQATAQEHRAGAEDRVKVAATGGNLKDEVRRQRVQETRKKDEDFRAKWEAKEALNRKPAYEKYLKQIPAVIGVLIGITLMLALGDMHRKVPVFRDIPPLVAIGDWFASVRDGLSSVGP